MFESWKVKEYFRDFWSKISLSSCHDSDLDAFLQTFIDLGHKAIGDDHVNAGHLFKDFHRRLNELRQILHQLVIQGIIVFFDSVHSFFVLLKEENFKKLFLKKERDFDGQRHLTLTPSTALDSDRALS